MEWNLLFCGLLDDDDLTETIVELTFVFQFWSPVVRGTRDEKYLLTGLYDMADEFEDGNWCRTRTCN